MTGYVRADAVTLTVDSDAAACSAYDHGLAAGEIFRELAERARLYERLALDLPAPLRFAAAWQARRLRRRAQPFLHASTQLLAAVDAYYRRTVPPECYAAVDGDVVGDLMLAIAERGRS